MLNEQSWVQKDIVVVVVRLLSVSGRTAPQSTSHPTRYSEKQIDRQGEEYATPESTPAYTAEPTKTTYTRYCRCLIYSSRVPTPAPSVRGAENSRNGVHLQHSVSQSIHPEYDTPLIGVEPQSQKRLSRS